MSFVGGRTACGIARCDPQFEAQRFQQNAVGLHHHCWRARWRGDVEAVYTRLTETRATNVHGPEAGGWAPGYFSVLFEDPAGTQLEVNFVSDQGVLAGDAGFDPSGDYA